MSTTTDLTTLKINYLTQAQYDAALSGGTINENEIYLTPGADIPQPSSTVPQGVSGNAASAGTATTYSRSDHVHLVDSSAITTALGYTPFVPSYYFGGSSNTSLPAVSGLNTYTTLPLTKGSVSTSDWSVSSNIATTTNSGVYKVEGYFIYSSGSSSSTASVVGRLHIGSTTVNSRGLAPAGGQTAIHIGPVIINVASGTQIYWDACANVAGTALSGTNSAALTAVKIG